MEFRALVAGRLITYPANATFIIDRREGRKPYALVATKPTLALALAKFNRTKQPGTKTRLCVAKQGRLHPLLVAL